MQNVTLTAEEFNTLIAQREAAVTEREALRGELKVLNYARQISPGKNAMCPRTSAAFTVGTVPMGFAVMCQLASAPSAFYAVSVRRLALLHSGFLQTMPRGIALAFG